MTEFTTKPSEYWPGQEFRLTFQFFNQAAQLADPNAVTVQWQVPGAATVSNDVFPGGGLLNPNVGVYTLDLKALQTEAGIWEFFAQGTGGPSALDVTMGHQVRIIQTRFVPV